eukprot:TRINITY_DN57293_c0_g1_i1.p1 TRINITY_DN57293_c0_g1~~TRINITY_DN57293_c0_g1_i1.p1  ORF type:complete len:407 (+),score=51.95 TRINITY_DN57293_c0_g1_i1:36-1223(+)
MTTFNPKDLYAPAGGQQLPRVFASPMRYVQGEGAHASVGRYLRSLLPNCRTAALLASASGHLRSASSIAESLRGSGVAVVEATFGHESSLEEVDRLVAELLPAKVEVLVAAGGGKCIDTGKIVAHRLEVPCAVCPTLASNDAPCSALSIVYHPNGHWRAVEYFPLSPLLVVVDTGIVARAPLRYLVSGMGDALATWYEAQVVSRCGMSTCIGARQTLAGLAVAQRCATTLFENGPQAAKDCHANRVTPALEDTVEANTLLSGLGFESGGLALAHAIAAALTKIPRVEQKFLHGEQVAIGLLTQLAYLKDDGEADCTTRFCAAVGLPCHFGQVGINLEAEAADALVVAEAAVASPYSAFAPKPTVDTLLAAMHAADQRGRAVFAELDDAAYSTLHS